MKLTEIQVVETVGPLSISQLRLWVESGLVTPTKSDDGHVYDPVDVARIKLVYELQQDLDLNEEAIPVILSLMDQIYGLRRELRTLTQAVERQPEAIRHRIRRALLELRAEER